MGERVEGIGVELPLSLKDRARIVSELSGLDEKIVGRRHRALTRLVECAVKMSPWDEPFHKTASDFGPQAEVFDRVRCEFESELRRLLEAAKVIARYLPPEEPAALQGWQLENGWHHNFDIVAAAVDALGISTPVRGSENIEAILRQATGLLTRLDARPAVEEAPCKSTILDPTSRLVRSVMYYRSRENLPVSVEWSSLERRASQPWAHRSDDELAPQSNTAVLVAHVARVFNASAPNKRLRTIMNEYQALCRSRPDRLYRWTDFLAPFSSRTK